MKRNPKWREETRAISEINVTPLVDVSLVLVIIFMVTVPMMLTPLADVVLPKAVTGLEERKDVVFVSFTRAEEVVMDRTAVPMQDFSRVIKERLEASQSKVVIFRVDEFVAYRHVKRIMEVAEKAGARKLVIATELKP